jgi:hypothetical protein
MTIDQRCQELASRCPFGLMTVPDAARVGVSRFALADGCRRGVLDRVAPGLYTPVGRTHPLQRYAIPQRYLDRFRPAGGDDIAPALTGSCSIDVRCGELSPLTELLVAVPDDRVVRLRRPPFDVLRLPEVQMTTPPDQLRGIRLRPAAHALADEATPGRREDQQVRDAVDRARNRLRLSEPHLVEAWQACGTAGARRLLRMAARGTWEQESEGERRTFRALFVGKGPLPDCQVVLVGGYRVDFVFLDAALVIEYDGREAHERRWEADLLRRMALEQAGFKVIVVTAAMLCESDRLAAFVRAVRRTRVALIAEGRLPLPPVPPQPPRSRPLRTLAHWAS